jgi:hypothetical protein
MKVTFPMLLFTVFLVLKLCKVIDWSWLWVTCPIWGGFVVFFVIFFIIAVVKAAGESR